MKVDVLLGLQWGDEGKGKIVDYLCPKYDIIARFQGGPNAGHTLKFENTKHVLHTIPSGIFRENVQNVVGNGVVIDPVIFKNEIDALVAMGVPVAERLLISKKAHLILPTHRLLDAASEAAKGAQKIGSTLKGIGPTYMDKTGRNGLRVGDLLRHDFEERYQKLVNKHKQLLELYDFKYELAPMEPAWFEAVDQMRSIQLIDSEQFINDSLQAGKKILAEGAQGSLLDIDFGSYPYVTSSNTLAAGACNGLGIAPNKIGEVFGVFKAYSTRVGSGPFPTELKDDTGRHMAEKGQEFGSTTGRPRRCGWLDIPALKYAIMLNGVTQLFMMKADVLSGLDPLSVCTYYNTETGKLENMPYDLYMDELKPGYQQVSGWMENINEASMASLPHALNAYIDFIERATHVPITIVSVGPDRAQTIIREKVTA